MEFVLIYADKPSVITRVHIEPGRTIGSEGDMWETGVGAQVTSVIYSIKLIALKVAEGATSQRM